MQGRPSWRSLPTPARTSAADAVHWAQCALRQTDAGCLRCKMIWWASAWKHASWGMVDAKKPELGSWIGSRMLSGGLSAGCLVCFASRKALGRTSSQCFPWTSAKSLTSLALQRHMQTEHHRRAVANVTGRPLLEKGTAPGCAEFEAVLDHRLSGRSLYQSGHRMKWRRMQWCIAEAMRSRDRRAFASAKCFALHPDSCGPRHVVRYAAGFANASVRRGILGLGRIGENKAGHGADKLATTTMRILEHACTAGYGAPPRSHGLPLCQQPCLLQSLFNHVRKSVEIWDPDAASDERSAGLSLLRERLGDGLPGLKTRTVDATHAARLVS